MDLSFRAFLARPGSTPHAQKRSSLMEKSIQQRGKFFQLDYLFAEPIIDRFSRATRRKRSNNKQKNTQKTMQLTSTPCSPLLERTRIHTVDMKNNQKKVSKKTLEHQGALFIGDRGDTIHSMKYDSRLRTISSINEHKLSDAGLKKSLKNKIGDYRKEGEKMSHRKIDQQCLMFTLSAQGVNYSQRVRAEERIRQRNKMSLDKSKEYIPKKDVKKEEKIMKIKEFRRRETKICRPWSPVNHSGHQQVGLDDLLTLQ